MQHKFVMGAGGNEWDATALRLADAEGLNARKIVAQGKASLRATTRGNRPQVFQTVKGRQNFLCEAEKSVIIHEEENACSVRIPPIAMSMFSLNGSIGAFPQSPMEDFPLRLVAPWTVAGISTRGNLPRPTRMQTTDKLRHQ